MTRTTPSTRTAEAPGWAPTLLICAFIATAQMTWGAVVPVLPIMVADQQLPTAVLGPVIAAFAIGRVLVNIPAGLALRGVPPRALMLATCLLLTAVTAATGLVTDPALLVVARLVAGVLGGAAVTVGFSVLLAGAPSARRGRVVAVATVVQMSAAAVGATLGGAVVAFAGVAAAFAAAAVPVLLVTIIDVIRPARAYWSSFERASAPAGRPPVPRGDRTADLALVVALAAVSFALFFARFGIEQGLVPVLAYEQGGLDPLGLGLALGAGTVLSMVALPFVGRAVDRGARTAVIAVSGIGAALAVVAFGLAAEPIGFTAAIVGYAVATSVANVVPGVVTAEAFPGTRSGFVVGVTRTAGDVGAAAGPLAAFWLAERFDVSIALGVVAAVLAALIGWFGVVVLRQGPAASVPAAT
ncbi:MFS transporter [Agromyces intestinalis]|uniref:MFS transporter n=1 Tax=Agromyces intestinalis TaxID=2592652 RepID=A0A5C1YFQ9_9MICO|nr:MFS transporter [Agromyces intestinalis]QEO14934.1 MFS transporter [Agromyces intestinalis]